MKKNKFKKILMIFVIIEIVLLIFNYIDKCKIAQTLDINSVSDFKVEELKKLSQNDQQTTICIKFKISTDKYNKYALTYEDVKADSNVYVGEVANKKKMLSNKYYMCYYENIIYSQKEKSAFREMEIDRFLLKTNNIILICLVAILILFNITKMKNSKKQKSKGKDISNNKLNNSSKNRDSKNRNLGNKRRRIPRIRIVIKDK